MLRLILTRVLHAALVMLGTSLLVYFLVNFAGGNIALNLLPETATNAQIAALRHKLGLDEPLYIQYIQWLGGILRGNFGNSFVTDTPAMSLVLTRFPATIELALCAEVLSLAVSIPLGVLSAVRRGSIWDRICMVLALIGQSVPNFWLGLMLILVLAVEVTLLPVSGRTGPLSVVIPAITLAAAPTAAFARILRSTMIEVLEQDYVRTARAKGAPPWSVVYRHALRNAILPFITVVGLELGTLLNGSVVVETVSAWPGVGFLLVQSLAARDIPVIESGVLLIALIFVGVNLVVDILYAAVDPRVRYS